MKRALPQPLSRLLADVRACSICEPDLPHGVRPVLQVSATARILIAGQAPGRRVHETGVPFDDSSGDRLRTWMGIGKDQFYDERRVAIIPMGLCYPGTTSSGDLPPRPACAPAWREKLLSHIEQIEFTLVIGRYAQRWHLREVGSVTDTVRNWRAGWPDVLPLPHPSPRNQIWLRRNPWFEEEVVPVLQERVASLM